MVFRSGLWPEFSFPSPVGVMSNLWAGFRDTSFLIAIAVSLKRVITGYFISLVIGLTLGLTVVRVRYLDENLSPLLLGLQTLPSICWLPLAILWFGIGEDSIIFVIAIGSIFSISMAAVSGIKNVPPLYMRVAKTMGAKGLKAYTTVVIPAALPSIISGMKQGWSFAWRALMAGEMLSPKDGLGYALTVGRDLADMNQVVSVMIIIIVLGLVIDKLIFGRLESSIRYRWGLDRA
ncbi:binding-protein-dependent transport system inner membrane protein [Thermincola ferriacetica]|uniref:Binding-protein-dependent transport systems inner membrane component n=3 Tax=Thermincola TaxID=278993 RepID=D5X9J0_THEPJ|nr:binding-protein-dependent transport systems inner membrane component [Thermincola potens JR]KNZ70580.1 binding-protein-dependent transport system inner membrane protein [Thermincola ferriacetica]